MTTGHLGIALGARKLEDTAPLWLLLAAAELPDWADAGACVVHGAAPVPRGMYTHSVLAIIALAAIAALVCRMVPRLRGGALVVALLVVSHILADYLTGLKPTWPGGPMIGFELYAHPIIESAIEGAVVLAGWLAYRDTLAPDVRRSWRAALPLGFLLALQGVVVAYALSGRGFEKC